MSQMQSFPGFGPKRPGPRQLTPAPPPRTRVPAMPDTGSPLSELLPVQRTVTGGFATITIPQVAGGLQITAGESAWYGLIDVDVAKLYGQDVVLSGVTLEQASCNISGGEGEVSWGDKHGQGACLLIGTDLPFRYKAWSSAVCHLPGIEVDSDPVEQRSGYVCFASYFPPGDYDATTPIKQTIIKTFTPYVFHLRRGQRLQAGVVFRRSDIHGAAAVAPETINGHVFIEPHIGLTRYVPIQT